MQYTYVLVIKYLDLQTFQVRPGYVLTMHFPYSMSKVDYAAEISVYDGPDSRGNLLTTIRVKNETFPQSVTGMRDTIYLEFKAKPAVRVLFYVELSAGKGEILNPRQLPLLHNK